MPMTDEEYDNRSRDIVVRYRKLNADVNRAFASGQIDEIQYKRLLKSVVNGMTRATLT